MSFKVIRNESGAVVAFGPNEDWYDPAGEYLIEEDQPEIYVDPKDAIRAEIASLEAKQLLPRITREFMLGVVEAQYASEGVDPYVNEGYVRLKEFDQYIASLREQL